MADKAKCPDCGDEFVGPGAYGRMLTHQASEHPEPEVPDNLIHWDDK